MITKQDLVTLKRLYTPLSKILLKHFHEDHGCSESGEIRFATLDEENRKLRKKLDRLQSANPFTTYNQKQEKEIRALLASNSLLEDEVNELIEEFNFLKADYVEVVNQLSSNIFS